MKKLLLTLLALLVLSGCLLEPVDPVYYTLEVSTKPGVSDVRVTGDGRSYKLNLFVESFTFLAGTEITYSWVKNERMFIQTATMNRDILLVIE